jgi:dihydroxyacetone kinase DhaKLM complex PTS-EIIA-like component DhaM
MGGTDSGEIGRNVDRIISNIAKETWLGADILNKYSINK